MATEEAERQKREREILKYLQQKLQAKALKTAIKADGLAAKPAPKNLVCTFCRRTIVLGTPYVAFKGQGSAYRGKPIKREQMHQPCLNRYLRPGVSASLS